MQLLFRSHIQFYELCKYGEWRRERDRKEKERERESECNSSEKSFLLFTSTFVNNTLQRATVIRSLITFRELKNVYVLVMVILCYYVICSASGFVVAVVMRFSSSLLTVCCVLIRTSQHSICGRASTRTTTMYKFIMSFSLFFFLSSEQIAWNFVLSYVFEYITAVVYANKKTRIDHWSNLMIWLDADWSKFFKKTSLFSILVLYSIENEL